MLVTMIGRISSTREVMIEEESRFITFTWSCTKFSVPKTDG